MEDFVLFRLPLSVRSIHDPATQGGSPWATKSDAATLKLVVKDIGDSLWWECKAIEELESDIYAGAGLRTIIRLRNHSGHHWCRPIIDYSYS